MPAENPSPRKRDTPQIDFRQFFPQPPAASSPQDEVPPTLHFAEGLFDPQSGEFSRRARLTGADWANVIFVAITFLGGLFCAFQIFKDAEPFRRASAWPRELLYPRPSGDVPMFSRAAGQVPSSTSNFGSPFDRGVVKSGEAVSTPRLSPSPSAASPNPNNPSPSSPIPNSPSPPSFYPGPPVTDANRARSQDAHRTVNVVTTPPSKTGQSSSKSVKSVAHQSEKTAVKPTRSQSRQNSRQISFVTNVRQNQATTAVRGQNNVNQQTMSVVRGMTLPHMSGPGSAQAAGMHGGGGGRH